MTILAAARAGDLERDDLGHSVFAATLLNALSTGVADTNKDKVLSVEELVAYVTDGISRLSAGQQQAVSFVRGFTNWPLVEGLTAREDEERRALVGRFLERLQRWSLKDLITIETRLHTIDVLLRWGDAKGGMAPADIELIRAVKAADLEGPSTPDELQARRFERRVQAIKW